ncbi:hypothetical protein, partial [Enterobacter cloacae complex sp. 4DZ3-17B2]|uniref:hypothetical protein n=1 Tax=Enterobacter cloacae complex sp. 4DZ3-17B2 TaxID=2511990 RepID=UPI001CA574DE
GEYHGIMKYPLTNAITQLRNHDDTVRLMLQADADNPIFGIKYPSPLINLRKFDIIKGFTPDYMHMALPYSKRRIEKYSYPIFGTN